MSRLLAPLTGRNSVERRELKPDCSWGKEKEGSRRPSVKGQRELGKVFLFLNKGGISASLNADIKVAVKRKRLNIFKRLILGNWVLFSWLLLEIWSHFSCTEQNMVTSSYYFWTLFSFLKDSLHWVERSQICIKIHKYVIPPCFLKCPVKNNLI